MIQLSKSPRPKESKNPWIKISWYQIVQDTLALGIKEEKSSGPWLNFQISKAPRIQSSETSKLKCSNIPSYRDFKAPGSVRAPRL